MSIKRILLPINGHDDIRPIGQLAFDIAHKIGAHVEVLHPYTPYYDVITSVGESGSPGRITRDIEDAKQRFERENMKSKQLFAELTEIHPDVTANFVELAGKTSDIVTVRAFSSDLIVLGSAATLNSPFWRDVYDGALFYSGRPVLIAPANLQPADVVQNFASELLVAWGGTAESARAMAAAEPFFAAANRVRVVTVSDDDRKIDAAKQMTEYARLHGANASVNVVEPDAKGIARTLLDEAGATPGTLLVMGAYSHARWRERVFGGVTEHALHHAHVPILMAH